MTNADVHSVLFHRQDVTVENGKEVFRVTPVEAEVVSANADGSLNLLYPHASDASVLANADNCVEDEPGALTPHRWSPIEEASIE